jgi:hypothetical protein
MFYLFKKFSFQVPHMGINVGTNVNLATSFYYGLGWKSDTPHTCIHGNGLVYFEDQVRKILKN